MASGGFRTLLVIFLINVLLTTCTRAVGLNGDCDKNDPAKSCDDKSLTCDTGTNKCVCSPNYREQTTGKCSAEVGTTCANANECVLNTICETTCKCSKGFDPQEGGKLCYKKIGEVCNKDTDCNKDGAKQDCKDGKCSCTAGYYREGDTCRGLVDTTCDDTTNLCITHAVCETKKCKCETGYKSHKDKFCTKDVTGECQSTDNTTCGLPWMTCKSDNTCDCAKGYVKDADNACRGLTQTACQITEECIKNAECNGFKCNCKNQYKTVDGNCVLAFNTTCATDKDCGGPQQVCLNKKCACAVEYHVNEDEKLCHYNLDMACDEKNKCGKPTLKCADGACVCNDGFIRVGETCEYNFGKDCDEQQVCGSEAMKCNNGICECSEKYFPDGNFCKAGLHTKCYGGDCNSTFAECGGVNTTCECLKGYKENDVYCSAPPTKACDEENGCSDQYSKCNTTSLVCECDAKHKLSSDKTKCSGSSFSASIVLAALALVLSRLW